MSTSVDQTPGEIVVADEEVEGSRPRACWSVRGCDWRDELPEDVIELLAPPVIVSAEAFVPAVEPTVPASDVQPAVLDGEAGALAVLDAGVEVAAVLDGEAGALAVLDGEAGALAVLDGEAGALAVLDRGVEVAAVLGGDAEPLPASGGDADDVPPSPDDGGLAAYRPRHAAPEEPQVTFTVPPRRLRRRRPAAA